MTKRSFPGWWAIVSADGRALAVDSNRDRLRAQLADVDPGGDTVRCTVVVDAARVRTTRPGRAAAKRRRDGGARAVGREALSTRDYSLLVAEVHARDDWRCLFCRAHNTKHDATVLEAHHVVKRSQGGADHPDNLVSLCAACHRWTDAPFADGRLIVEALGQGRFECYVVKKADKWAPDPAR